MKLKPDHKSSPTLDEEMALFTQGYSFIAGLDEAGRGCLAGPVVAAAIMLPLTDDTQEFATVSQASMTPSSSVGRHVNGSLR